MIVNARLVQKRRLENKIFEAEGIWYQTQTDVMCRLILSLSPSTHDSRIIALFSLDPGKVDKGFAKRVFWWAWEWFGVEIGVGGTGMGRDGGWF